MPSGVKRWPLLVGLGCAALSGCSAESLPEGELALTSGQESDVWSLEPAVERVEVTKILSDGRRQPRSELSAPVTRLSLGRADPGAFELRGFAGDGSLAVGGRTLPLDPAGLAGLELPLCISRANHFARPPGQLASAQPERPPAVVIGGRHLLLLGGRRGDLVEPAGYDLGLWKPHPAAAAIGCPAPPCRFESVALAPPSRVLAIAADWAIWFDADALTSGTVPLPAGLASFAEVSGGRTVVAPSGEAYVVGGSRAQGEPTTAVLELRPDGSVVARHLAVARRGAAAGWIPGRGLVVVGGSAEGAGAELLPEGAEAFTPLPYAPDETTGAALAPDGTARALRLGGRQPDGAFAASVVVDLGCGAECALTEAGAPVEFGSAQAFAAGEQLVVVGDDADGQTRALRWAPASVEPLLLREARLGATALTLPTGHVAIAGGTSPDGQSVGSIELLFQ